MLAIYLCALMATGSLMASPDCPKYCKSKERKRCYCDPYGVLGGKKEIRELAGFTTMSPIVKLTGLCKTLTGILDNIITGDKKKNRKKKIEKILMQIKTKIWYGCVAKSWRMGRRAMDKPALHREMYQTHLFHFRRLQSSNWKESQQGQKQL